MQELGLEPSSFAGEANALPIELLPQKKPLKEPEPVA